MNDQKLISRDQVMIEETEVKIGPVVDQPHSRLEVIRDNDVVKLIVAHCECGCKINIVCDY